jgi:hypothetical protein
MPLFQSLSFVVNLSVICKNIICTGILGLKAVATKITVIWNVMEHKWHPFYHTPEHGSFIGQKAYYCWDTL